MSNRSKAKGKGGEGGSGTTAVAPIAPEDKVLELLGGSVNEDVDDDQKSFVEGYEGISLRLRGIVSTRCATLDNALGRGGVPLGRLTILTGADGCGKTTQALELVAEVQLKGGLAGFLDAEHKLDIPYAERIGVNMKLLILSQPTTMEGMFAFMEKWIAKAAEWREIYGDVPVVLFLDSVNAAVPKAVLEGDWDQVTVAAQSRFFSLKLPKLIGMAQRAGVGLVFIAQLRDKIGVRFGPTTHISGGRAIMHHATVIVKYTRIKKITRAGQEDPVAIMVKAQVDKNQIAPPFREAEFMIRLGHGFDQEAALIDAGIAAKVLTQKGAWISFGDDRLGNGVEQASGLLRKKPEIADQVREAIRNADAS
ncbi:hypothetical protein LCGC14_0460300 [marine sediment metagenome]|uniref:RecA family profile 1 domain-containing protein n=1 Tax=marine sediment metagenome TaxID=412755 RepID=A0A0F9SFB8_9ZZZZ